MCEYGCPILVRQLRDRLRGCRHAHSTRSSVMHLVMDNAVNTTHRKV